MLSLLLSQQLIGEIVFSCVLISRSVHMDVAKACRGGGARAPAGPEYQAIVLSFWAEDPTIIGILHQKWTRICHLQTKKNPKFSGVGA